MDCWRECATDSLNLSIPTDDSIQLGHVTHTNKLPIPEYVPGFEDILGLRHI